MEFNKNLSRAVVDRVGMHSRAGPNDFLAQNDAQTTPVPPESKRRERLPFLTKIVLFSLLLPAFFSVGSLVFTPSKLLFLFVVPILTLKLLRGAYGRLLPSDFLVFGYAGWMTLAMLANHTPRVAVEYTGSNTVIFLGGYLTARATIRSKESFVALIRFLVVIVILTLPFAIYEVITSRTTIPRWLAQLPGIRSHADINHDPRFGLWRAQVVFPHPIHYGIFSSMAFSLAYVGLAERLRSFRRTVATGLVGLSCFLSVSSGPVLALAAQIGLIGWAGLFRHNRHRWVIFWTLGILSYIIAELASGRSAVYAIVTRISFSSQTAFARRILFNYGVEQIGRKPLLGVGYNSWPLPAWMTGSVDNFWLFVAVRFGLPAFILLSGAFVVAMIIVGRRDFSADPELCHLRRAWIFTLVSLMLVLATVAIWGEVYSMVLFMLGSGLWMTNTDPAPNVPRTAVAGDEPKRLSRYTRFAGTKPNRTARALRFEN